MVSQNADWTSARLSAALDFLQARVRADFVGTVAAAVTLRFDPAFSNRPGNAAPGPDHLVATAGGHTFSIDLKHGVEDAASRIASGLQDDVMDDLGRPWPELIRPDGQPLGVLEPGGDAIACWSLRATPFCAIGHLHAAVKAAGLVIK
jgi:hypothetical protein